MYKEGYTILTGPVKHAPKGEQAVRKAQKAGQKVEYVKKAEHANKHAKLEGHQIARIMNDEDDHKPPTISHDLRIAIAQARNAKGWTQEQFAHVMCIPKADINSWENGKGIPSGIQIAKMDKVLGVKLPRPNKG